ncbi:hypothetical protein BJV82DRAFT_584419 [Fennellomyces sp. T-0311]|nr:hypothetical protein BJV82DRAFT_584419 [Fennellomyces sp. T-0311]
MCGYRSSSLDAISTALLPVRMVASRITGMQLRSTFVYMISFFCACLLRLALMPVPHVPTLGKLPFYLKMVWIELEVVNNLVLLSYQLIRPTFVFHLHYVYSLSLSWLPTFGSALHTRWYLLIKLAYTYANGGYFPDLIKVLIAGLNFSGWSFLTLLSSDPIVSSQIVLGDRGN